LIVAGDAVKTASTGHDRQPADRVLAESIALMFIILNPSNSWQKEPTLSSSRTTIAGAIYLEIHFPIFNRLTGLPAIWV
jgi:hypothetical protein